MNYLRQKRQKRKPKPRPKTRVGGCLHSFTNKMFFCIWNDDQSANEPDYQVQDVEERRTISRYSSSQISLLSYKESPYRLHQTYLKIMRNMNSSNSINNSNVNCTRNSELSRPSTSGLNAKGQTSQSSLSTCCPSLVSGQSLQEELPTVQGDDRSQIDMDTETSYSLSHQKEEKLVTSDQPFSSNLSLKDVQVNISKSSSLQSLPEKIKSKWAGLTVPDIYSLIKRTLNLRSSNVRDSSSLRNAQCQAPITSVPTNREEKLSTEGVSALRSLSLHKLHTEWNENIVNVEVLLGLKAPKSSREALAVREEYGDDIPDWYPMILCSAGCNTSPNFQSNGAITADSGFASRGNSTTV